MPPIEFNGYLTETQNHSPSPFTILVTSSKSPNTLTQLSTERTNSKEKCNRKYYNKSWTMTQKHMEPPPLNLIGFNKEIEPSKLKKIIIATTTTSGTEKIPVTSSSTMIPTITTPGTLNTVPMVNTSNSPPKPCCCSEELKKTNRKLDELTYLVKDLSRRLTNQNSGRSTEVDHEVKMMFSIKTNKELEDLEARCVNSAFRDTIMNHLTNLVSLGKGLTVAFQNLLSDQLSISFNFSGTHKKIPFMKFKRINGIMFDAWKSPVDSIESFQTKLRCEFRKAHNRVHNKKTHY